MGIKITASLSKDKHNLHNSKMIGFDLIGEPNDKELQLFGFLQGYVISDSITIMLGRFLDPVMRGLIALKMNADISVRFNGDIVIITVCENQ